jgi:hypothetical protein
MRRQKRIVSARSIFAAYGRKPLVVEHASLERADGSAYRSKCPACKDGILLVRRNQETMEILAEDNCIACGQKFVYSDIVRLR